MMKAIVLGLGMSGKAAASYLRKKDYLVTCVDRLDLSFEGMPVVKDSVEPQLQGVDLLIKSPGVAQSHPWVQAACQKGIPVMGEIDLAFEALLQKKKKVLAITGSNGKTTTTLLATHLLKMNGVQAVASGNIGIPLLNLIDSNYEVFVVELSSFQLETIQPCPVLDAAVILNITHNHLDRHASFDDYIHAKLKIASCLKTEAPLYMTNQVSHLCQKKIDPAARIKKIETIFSSDDRKSDQFFFPHDLENAAAAYALTSVPLAILQEGMKNFVKPPHRLEFVQVVAGITYVNDSKATSVDAVIKAVQTFDKPILLIAGGVDKGGAFRDWIPHFRGKVKCIFVLGEAARRITEELSSLKVYTVDCLEEGVKRATQEAEKGDIVLLSPGCSSYDQFIDYQHRGDLFKKIVLEQGRVL